MGYGIGNIERAVGHFKTAIRFAEEATAVEVPLFAGRTAASEHVTSLLGSAGAAARRASDELRHAPDELQVGTAGLHDVRHALAALTNATDEVWQSPSPFARRAALSPVLENAREAQLQLSELVDPAVTRSSLFAELHTLLAKPDAAITSLDMRRIAQIERNEVIHRAFDDKALGLPASTDHALEPFVRWNESGTSYSPPETLRMVPYLQPLRDWMSQLPRG